MGLLVNTFGFPHGVRGIPPDEVTVAEALQAGGYSTAMFGKWHLGDRSPHLPTEKGFDYFFGSYYSNDMEPYAIYRNGDVAIEAPADQTTLTEALTGEILRFIDRAQGRPFFVYYASPFPHHPVHSSDRFAGRSNGGAYGDCVEELDWSVGQIRAKLSERGLAQNSLLVFTSDNGPWHQGSPGHHRGRKANSFDGGLAVPVHRIVARDHSSVNRDRDAGHEHRSLPYVPEGGRDPGPRGPDRRRRRLVADAERELPATPDRQLFFARGGGFVGVRGPDSFKYVARHRSDNSAYWVANHGPFLFDLAHDPTESYDVSERLPRVRADLARAVDEINRQREENPRGWRTGR